MAEQRLIRDIEINPLLVSPTGVLALDARIILHPQTVQVKDLPRLAIRPYPRRYESKAISKSGREVLIRPIRPEDEPRIIKFHATLSERTVYFRYLQMMNLSQRTAHERLIRICFIDYDRELALVATYDNDIVGVCRLHKIHGSKDAEFAIVISDDFQGQGLGKILLDRMIAVARHEGVEHVIADIHAENTPMQAIVRKLGFQIHNGTFTGAAPFNLNRRYAGVFGTSGRLRGPSCQAGRAADPARLDRVVDGPRHRIAWPQRGRQVHTH